jgi:hypothetical protein
MPEAPGPGPDNIEFTHVHPSHETGTDESMPERQPIPENLTPQEVQPIARADMERAAVALRNHPEIVRQRGMEYAASYQNHTVPTLQGLLSYRCSPTGEEVKIHTIIQETMGHGREAVGRMEALAAGTAAEHQGTEITYRSDQSLVTVQTGAEYPHANLKSGHAKYIRTVVDAAMPLIGADEVTRDDLK